jgi:aminoglycoside 3-N-acetyltransferase
VPPPNTIGSLSPELRALGLDAGVTVMVHSSLGKVGWTEGGPVTVIRALFDVIASAGTLAMPAETPLISDPGNSNDVFDPLTTPTTMGAIAEAFRTFPGTMRSNHPLASTCANGPLAKEITAEHSLEFCEGKGTPFEKLYTLDAYTLLLGVGFNRCTSLHYAESLVPARRTMINRFPMIHNSVHFPVVGQQFVDTGAVRIGRVGNAQAMFFSTRRLVDFAEAYFRRVLG